MADISKLSPRSGRIIGEDGKIYNRVSLLRGTVPISDKVVDISKMAAESGRLIGEDGKIYNEVDLLTDLTDKMDDIEGEVEDLSKLTKWLGITTTPITENSTVNPIMISGVSVMAVSGDITKYGNDNFKFSDVGTWQYYNDKTDVYTKDETDLLLDEKVDKIPGKVLSSNDFTDAYVAKVNTSENLLKNNAPKNLLYYMLEDLKAANTAGAWGTTSSYRTTYTVANATFTVKTNGSGIVESISTGEAMIFESGAEMMYAVKRLPISAGSYILSAQIDDAVPTDAKMYWTIENLGGSVISSGDVTLANGYNSADITVSAGAERYLSVYYAIGDRGVTPLDPHFGALGTVQTMLRYAEVADNTFEVAYRTQKDIDAALTSVQNGLTSKLDKTGGTVTGAVKTTKSTFTDDDEFVPKSYVDTHGITDYTQLTNKPSINNVTLTGNKTLSELGLSEHDNYTKTLLWENTSGMTVVSPITLADDYTNYDLVAFELAINALNNVQEFVFSSAQISKTCCLSYQTKSMGVNATSNTTLNAVTWDGGNSYNIQKIYGINLGARKPYKETILWTNTTSTSGSNIPFTLTERADSFNAITLCLAFTGSATGNYKFITVPNSMLGVGGISEEYGSDHWFGISFNNPPISGTFSCVGQWTLSEIIGINYGGETTVYEMGTPDYDNRIPFTQADLPYTVPCDGYLYIGGWQSRVSLKYKDADNNYVNMAFASTSGEIAEYGMYPVTKDMILEYNEISGAEAKMYIVPIEYNAIYTEVDDEMSDTSENPVQNKVIKEYVDDMVANSGGVYTETVLYDGGTTATVGTVQLSQPITDFDAITFVFHKPDGSAWVKNVYTYPTSTIPNGWTPEYGPIGLYVENDNITFGWNNGNGMYPFKVIGINYGSSSAYTETRLYTNPDGQRHDSITLSDQITNYDCIVVDFIEINGYVNSQKIIDRRANAILAAKTNNLLNVNFDIAGVTNAQVYVEASAPLVMNFAGANGYRINDVIGITFGGSVRGRTVSTLYTEESTTTPATIELSEAYTNFDEIYLIGTNTADQTIVVEESYITNNLIAGSNLRLLTTGSSRIVYEITDTTHLSKLVESGNVRIYKILGIKYDSEYITIDTQISSTSTNPIQNKAVKEYVDAQIAAITDYESEVFPNE